MAPREWYPIWGPYPNSVGGVRISIKYILLALIMKRDTPPPQGPPLCCRDRDPPSGGGLQAYLPHPLKRIQKITSLYYLVKKIPYRPPINRVN